MKNDTLKRVLQDVHDGKLSIDKAVSTIHDSFYLDLGCATFDLNREARKGFPEVIFGENKTDEQIMEIVYHASLHHKNILATRVSESAYKKVTSKIDDARYDPVGRTVIVEREPLPKKPGNIAIICAGTSDLPVAQEAKVTAELMGSTVTLVLDVGVAGIHRLFDKSDLWREAMVLIVIAGMEGALPSVVGGLVNKPVIAVPTSTGYGANFQGLAPLLGMLNSCAPGISVVNIDNGFGAGYCASVIHSLVGLKKI
ncbi:MAG: nickel pincer cofactor biosynthesis protein LarB [bacterium]